MEPPSIAEPKTPNNIAEILIRIQVKLNKIKDDFRPFQDNFNSFSKEETNSNNYVKTLIADLNTIKEGINGINDPKLQKLVIDINNCIQQLFLLETAQMKLIPNVDKLITAFNDILKTESETASDSMSKVANSKADSYADNKAESIGGRKTNNKKSKRRKSNKRRKINNKKYGGRKSNNKKSKRRKTKKRDQIGDELYMAALVAAAVNIGDSTDTSEVDI